MTPTSPRKSNHAFNIRRRLAAGFLAIVLLGSGVCTAVLVLLTASIHQLEDVVTVADSIRQKGMKLRFDMMRMSDSMRGYLIDPTSKSEAQRKRDADDEFLRDVEDIRKLGSQEEVRHRVPAGAP